MGRPEEPWRRVGWNRTVPEGKVAAVCRFLFLVIVVLMLALLLASSACIGITDVCGRVYGV